MSEECNVLLHYRTFQHYEWINESCHFLRLPCVGECVELVTQSGSQKTFRVAMVRHFPQMVDEQRGTDTTADAEVWVTEMEIMDAFKQAGL